MDEQEFAELAAGYAMNALSPADRQAFEAARRAHPEWERSVQIDVATVAALADGVPSALPPLTLRSTLLARVATAPQIPSMDAAAAAAADPASLASRRAAREAEVRTDGTATVEPAPNTAAIQAISRRNWTRGLFTLAASLMLLFVLGFGAVTLNDYVNRPAAVVALEQIENAPDAREATAELSDGGSATAHWSASLGKAVLVSSGLPQIADDQSFELWFVRESGPVSAGVFDPRSSGTAAALLDGEMEEGDVIAVTVEPAGGSPDGQPSADPIVAIPTT